MVLVLLIITSCSSKTYKNNDNEVLGVVISSRKIKEEITPPQKATLIGASTGLGAGAVTGGAIGVYSVLAVTLLFPVSIGATIPVILSSTLMGVGTGLVAGGAGGYVYDSVNSKYLFEYEIKELNGDQKIFVRQRGLKPFINGQMIKMIWDENKIKILPIEP